MKKKLFTLLCIILSLSVMAQNKDSLEFVNYFKEGQKNFKYIKAMDSLITIVDSLGEVTKNKDRQIQSYEYAAKNVKANLKLYTFLLKIEKGTLNNLGNDTSEYFQVEDGLKKLMLKDDVNLETLAKLVGKKELDKQLPKVNSYIKNNIIKVVLPRVHAMVALVQGMSGYSLPDWPINTNISLPKEQLKLIYLEQENYIIKFCNKYMCGGKYLGMYREKQDVLQIPQQLQQLVINQILFKNFMDEKCLL